MNDHTKPHYSFLDAEPEHTHRYLWQPVQKILTSAGIQRVFDLGCGNGAFAHTLAEAGFDVTGVDPSAEGIQFAASRAVSPGVKIPLLAEGSAYEPLQEQYGKFPCVTSLEVIEHVYYPRKFANCVASLLDDGGIAVITTPYHGYWKNLALAVSGRFDSHFTALWDHGHIKFWSKQTLIKLFAEQGLVCEQFVRVGRFGPLAKSMVAVFRKS